LDSKTRSKKKRPMGIDEFNQAFKMLHGLYRYGKADEDNEGVDDLRAAIKDLISTNIPGTLSKNLQGTSLETFAEVLLIHGDQAKPCLVLKGSKVRKNDLPSLKWGERQDFIEEIKEAHLIEHDDGEHYVVMHDVEVENLNKSGQFVLASELNSLAEIFWFSDQFTWRSGYKSAIPIMDWLDDEESMKLGVTLEDYRKKVLNPTL
jgi:hypothetical protein